MLEGVCWSDQFDPDAWASELAQRENGLHGRHSRPGDEHAMCHDDSVARTRAAHIRVDTAFRRRRTTDAMQEALRMAGRGGRRTFAA